MVVVHNVQVVALFCKLRIVHKQQLRDFEGRWKIFAETETETDHRDAKDICIG